MTGADTMRTTLFTCWLLAASGAAAGDLQAKRVAADLSKADPAAAYWAQAPVETVSLMAQPMIAPRPAKTNTEAMQVQAVHDGKRLALRLSWKDKDVSEAGRLGTFSDAAAVQFPVKGGDAPPAVMMGSKGDPVHIFHWRAQYQRDREKGKPGVKDLYPNASIDIYPLEFPAEAGPEATPREREQFSPGTAEGNPQAFTKTGVDEILAEGFSTSSVQAGHQSDGQAIWKDGTWTLVITRPLAIEGGSSLSPGGKSFVAFAAWQGGEGEVGSRKCVTMAWTGLAVGP